MCFFMLQIIWGVVLACISVVQINLASFCNTEDTIISFFCHDGLKLNPSVYVVECSYIRLLKENKAL